MGVHLEQYFISISFPASLEVPESPKRLSLKCHFMYSNLNNYLYYFAGTHFNLTKYDIKNATQHLSFFCI